MYALSATATGRYPWGVKAPETETLQMSLNAHLAPAKLCKIPVTGQLDAATCGAALAIMPMAAQTESRFMQEWAVAAPNCKEYGKAHNPPCPAGVNRKMLGVLAGAIGLSVLIVWKYA